MSDVMQVCVPVSANGTLAVGTTYLFGMRAPSDANGGGVTVVGVDFASDSAIAAASAPVYEVVKTTSAGVINGTAATVLGSAAWTAGTSRVGTLSTVFVDATEQLHVCHKQTAANADTPRITCVIEYVMGR